MIKIDIKITNIFTHRYLAHQNFYDFAVKYNELIFYFNGKGTVLFNNKQYEIKKRRVFITNSFDRRTQITEDYTEYICIRYLTSEHQNYCKTGIYEYDSEIEKLVYSLKREYENKNYMYFTCCNFMLGEILIHLSRIQQTQTDADIYSIIRLIDNSMGNVKSIHQLANDSGYSYDYFRHKFRKITGVYPTDYILSKKLESACTLLKTNKYSCTEIASLCGFKTLAQFSSIFKKKIGVSPTSLKK